MDLFVSPAARINQNILAQGKHLLNAVLKLYFVNRLTKACHMVINFNDLFKLFFAPILQTLIPIHRTPSIASLFI